MVRSVKVFLAVLLLCASSTLLRAQPETAIDARANEPSQPNCCHLEGKVTGVVVDEQNQPISHAQVSTLVSLPGELSGNGAVDTDDSGQFQIEHLRMGTFKVVASKGEDGYPGFSQAGMPTVVLTPEVPVANIVVNLGPREGILEPSVKDKVTGKPVYTFRLRWHVDGLNPSISGDSGFSQWTTRQSIPAQKDVLIDAVSARGYKEWTPSDPSDPSRPLQLHFQRGEVKALSIELEPEAKNSPMTP